jgi:hypothetical protein
VGHFIARFTWKRERAKRFWAKSKCVVRSGGNEETRERESRVWGIGAFRERERRGQGEGEGDKTEGERGRNK